MTQLFHPATNTFSRFSIFGAVFIAGAVVYILWMVSRSPYQTEAFVAREQPVQFSHAHHVGAMGIDCRYCHSSVEDAAFAGIPPVEICMGCHSQVWKDSPILEPVRESYRTKKPLRWTRVHDVPDFVYFDHSIHVAKGVGCVSCHGAVNEMPLMWKEHTLHMEWCLACHRKPEQHLRDKSLVFDMRLQPADEQLAVGTKLLKEYHIMTDQLDDCSVCHR